MRILQALFRKMSLVLLVSQSSDAKGKEKKEEEKKRGGGGGTERKFQETKEKFKPKKLLSVTC